MRHFFLSLLITITIYLISTTPASAEYQLPAFDSCHNPVGTVKENYLTGLHAIVGVTGLQSGSDKVFSNSNNNFTQCYCPPNGNTGVKTNWLAARVISKEDQNVLMTQGWVYIANGADWGLTNQPYLAKNIEFSCGGNGGDNGGGGGTDSGSGGSQSSSNGAGGGEVLGISTLAATSSNFTKYQVLLTFIIALSLIVYGYKIQKNSH